MAIDEKHTSVILLRMFENGVYSDRIILISETDNQRVSIHRAVLTASSKYFAAALGPNFREGNQSEFILDGIDGAMVKSIVDFCYSGRIDLSEGNVDQFLAIASSREFDLLEEKCWIFYAEKLSITNAVNTLMIADRYSNLISRQKAFDVVCESFETLPETDIQQLEHRLLLEILKCDEIQATEECVLQRVLKWFQIEMGEREQHMPELLKLIRLEYIPLQFLNGNTLQSAYKRFNCSDYVIAEYQRRITGQCTNIGVRRCKSIYCLFAHFKEEGKEDGDQTANYSAVKILKYNSVLNSCDEDTEIKLGDRSYFELMMRKNKIYIMGGSSNNIVLKSVSAFDLNSGEEELLPEMNSVRRCFTSILFGKFIYVFGGWNGTEIMNKCERFDTEAKTWQPIKPMNVARYYASATIVNGCIYIAGGGNDLSSLTDAVEVYNPDRDKWIPYTPMNKIRNAFALIKTGEFLYALGSHASIERYDPWNTCWTMVESFDECSLITCAIEIDGVFIAIMNNGKIGQLKFNENGDCSFHLLCKLKYERKNLRRHYLARN